MMRSYLDYNATAPLRQSAKRAMTSLLGRPLNPSSVHSEGREGRKAIEAARRHVAELVKCDPKAVTFTSGGTEANNTVLCPHLQAGATPQEFDILFVSDIEHPCVLAGGRFASSAIRTLPVRRDGVLDLEDIQKRLDEADRPFVSVMLANNETGVTQPIADLAKIVRERDGFLHTDAVQAAGKIPIDMASLDVDALTLSAHKIGGPQGAGALITRNAGLRFTPLLKGGGQEMGLRAGTENVAAIAGFGAAAHDAFLELRAVSERLYGLRERAETGLRSLSNEIVIFGDGSPRLPNTINFSLPGKRAETAIIAFDMAGIAVSSGSACSSGKVGPSHVLRAMGVPDSLAEGAIRVSMGPETEDEDVDRLLAQTARILGR
ncbi:MAG: cysteine desulfurase family protein [Pseudomonadota bacterium]